MVGDGAVNRLDAEPGVEGVGQLPGENRPTVPVDHGAQVHVAALDRDVGDVHLPDLVGSIDHQMAQQVAVDGILRVLPG